MKVKLTANARRRLQQIRDYHKGQGNAAKGRRIGRKILAESKKLEKYPELGQAETYLESEGKGHSYLLVKPFYKLIYFITKPFIFITDIFDTRQNPDDMRP
jgi:plasmid stabilization system protein ParE